MLPNLILKVKKLHEEAVLPQYATPGAACFDLHSIDFGIVEDSVIGGPRVFRTGLSFEVPTGHVMLVFSRSGHGFKHGIRLVNCVGVIDSDYRGEVMVGLTKDADGHVAIQKGDRIAQAMIIPIPSVGLHIVKELSETERGEGGFGSTGA